MAAVEEELYREMLMDDRLARLETHAEHFQKDLNRVEEKIDKLDERLDKKIDKLDERIDHLGERIDGLDEKLDEQRTSNAAFQLDVMTKLAEIVRGRMAERVWLLLIGAGILGVMARGFKWI